ncbi:MAG TPA: alpha/beta fold hydrolase [Amycolatopsis sp.]|jgi:pimeloyl-ACP methyl ester carboxylesterase
MEPTFVFAAGANGVSAAPVELLLRGYRGVGVPQPGGQFRRSYQAPQDLTAFATEPSPLAGRTVADDVAATVEVIRRVAGHGPVVLVGASIGGALITLAAEQVPELVSTLVYDTAFCCVDLATPGDYLATPEAADSQGGALLGFAAADPAVVGALRCNWRTASEPLLTAAYQALAADSTEAEFYALLNSLSPDDLADRGATDSRGTPERWGRIPRVYVRHLQDRLLPPALQNRMIREADAATPGNPFVVHDLDTAHFPSAAGMSELVEILDGVGRGLS